MGIAKRFHGKRCLVAGTGGAAEAVSERLMLEGGSVIWLGDPGTLACEASAVDAVQEAVGVLEGLDVTVTAFSFREDCPFLDVGDEVWQRSLDENLKAAFLVGRESARAMVAQQAGVIVHIGSDIPARPGPCTAAYAAAKAGVQLLTTGMALDLAPEGVRVCAVAAAEDGTPAFAGYHISNEELASAVAFCASTDASYVLGSTFFLTGPPLMRG